MLLTIQGGIKMAKLNEMSIVLDGKEGQILEGVRYAYVGVSQGGEIIRITPTTNYDAIPVNGDPRIKEHLLDIPHRVCRNSYLDQYFINVEGGDTGNEKPLSDYIGVGEYSVELVEMSTKSGVPVPAHLVLTRIKPQKEETPKVEEKELAPEQNSDMEEVDASTTEIIEYVGDAVLEVLMDMITTRAHSGLDASFKTLLGSGNQKDLNDINELVKECQVLDEAKTRISEVLDKLIKDQD